MEINRRGGQMMNFVLCCRELDEGEGGNAVVMGKTAAGCFVFGNAGRV